MIRNATSSFLLAALCVQLAHAQSFHLIPPLAGDVSTNTRGISSDGTTVIGMSIRNGHNEAIRWRLATGTQGLGDFPGGSFYSESWSCSANGDVIAGTGNAAGGPVCFRWTSDIGMSALTEFGFPIYGGIVGISDDGQTIAGNRSFPSGGFIWSAVSGVVSSPVLPGDTYVMPAQVTAVSGDAAWVWLRKGETAPYVYRWDKLNPPVAVSNWTYPIEIKSCSRDGSWATGMQNSQQLGGGVRCPASNYPQPLGSFQIGETLTSGSTANAISADASTIVGACTSTGTPPNFTRAMIWTADTGVQDLNAVALAAGVDLQGYTLVSADGVSGNGSTITGRAQFGSTNTYMSYWLQLPPKCEADFNHDGAIDFFDYLDFVDAYSIGCSN